MKVFKSKSIEIQSFDNYFVINDKERGRYKLQIMMIILFYLFVLVMIYFIDVSWYLILWGIAAIAQFIFLMRKDMSSKIDKSNIRHILVERNMFDRKIISILHPKKRVLGTFNKKEAEEIIGFLMSNK